MGLVNRCSWSEIDIWFCPYCFNGYEGGGDWMGTHRSVSWRVGDVVESSFSSGAVALSNIIDDSVKGCHIWGLPTGTV
jgi:hypothetical protein